MAFFEKEVPFLKTMAECLSCDRAVEAHDVEAWLYPVAGYLIGSDRWFKLRPDEIRKRMEKHARDRDVVHALCKTCFSEQPTRDYLN